MSSIDRSRMKNIIGKFRNQRVLVVGDLMLDKYIWGSVSRISPEAPVPVVEVNRDSRLLGGAGNVANNLGSLGAFPVLVGVVGRDESGRWIRNNVVDKRGIFMDSTRPTTIKTRIIAHHQQIVRVDTEKKKAVGETMTRKILDFVRAEDCRGIVLSDYSKGLMSESLLSGILSHAREAGIMVFVDPKTTHFPLFSPVTLITPNHLEAESIVRHECRTDAQVEKAGEEILSIVESRYLILKRGEQGMTVFERGKKPVHIPTLAKEVFDVTGAGDTVIAAAALALMSGANLLEAATISNAAAGIVVGKIGTATVDPEELLDSLDGV